MYFRLEFLQYQKDMGFCEFPSCATPTTANDGKYEWCIQEGKSTVWTFEYKACLNENTVRYTTDGNHFVCVCINNLFNDCHVDRYDNGTCDHVFRGVFSFQMVISLIAIGLNLLICVGFQQKVSKRKKNSNILLLNQALVDIVNCIIFAMPNAIFLLLQSLLKKEQSYTFTLMITSLILSASSSIFLFMIIAMERFLSLYNPIWHQRNVYAKRIWKTITLAWLIAVSLAAIVPAIVHSSPNTEVANHRFFIYRLFLLALLGILLLTITILHIWSFLLAYRAVHVKDGASEQVILRSKKQFRLLMLFIIMYIAFIIAFIALKVLAAMGFDYYTVKNQVLLCIFMMTSLLNPIVTLCLKPSFRPKFF